MSGTSLHMHMCVGLKGIAAPLVLDGISSKVEAQVREDYVKGEIVTSDEDGKPIMSIVTTREDGQDCAVLASPAQARHS